MRMLKQFLIALACVAIVACGGGSGSGSPYGGSAGNGGGGGSGGGGATPSAADLVLVLSAGTVANSGQETITATVTAVDSNRNIVSGVPVVIKADSSAVVTAAGSVTDSAGRLTATVGIGSDNSLRTITVTASGSGLTKTATLQVQAGAGAAGQASLTLNSSASTVAATAPVTITATLRDARNQPIPGRVVLFSSVRGLTTPSANSALTDSNGVVSVTVRPTSGGLSGADEIQGTASVQTTSGTNVSISSAVGLSVTGAAPTVSVALSPTTTTLRASTSPVDFIATVRNAAGNPVANQVVSFRSAAGLVSVTPASTLTDAAGRAIARISPASPTTNAADVISASTVLESQDLQSGVSVQIIGESPSVALTLSNSTVTATNPATVNATVRNASGDPVSGALVTFSTQFSLGQFTPATALTNSSGVASAALAIRAGTASGADIVRASTTVGTVSVTQQAAAQFVTDVLAGSPSLDLALSRTSVSAAQPADVTVALRNAAGDPVSGQVVTFNVIRGLATTNVATALTNASGVATVRLVPATAVSAGADEISASVSLGGTNLQRTSGFQVLATPVTLTSLAIAPGLPPAPLSAYGQTTLRLQLSGASVSSPTAVTIGSSCLALGKAVVSPTTFTATSDAIEIQYRDNGCGAVQDRDRLSATVTASGASLGFELPIRIPAESSIAFVQALPEQIFLRGSGFTESSVVTFEVRDAAGNPLPNRTVELRLTTGAGGVTMEGRAVEPVSPPSPSPFTANSDAQGRVSVRVNSGTLPTPIRIDARLRGSSPVISTVSSNLSVAVGLPSQLNFSLSQGTVNIEGYDRDGTTNTYEIIASDRSANPVPAGTSINFVAEGGQIEGIKRIGIVNGISRTAANFVSSSPRPRDGRITVVAYALGEESFLDTNGNNVYDPGELFQDLGNIYRDRDFDGSYNSAIDEFITLSINNSSACAPIASTLLSLGGPSIPSQPSSCDGVWSGAGQVYVRRAVETVLSTTLARPLWINPGSLLNATCSSAEIFLRTGPGPGTARFFRVGAPGGDRAFAGSRTGVLTFLVSDNNPERLNPMAAGTVVTAASTTPGLTVNVAGGTPVVSTGDATPATLTFNFTDAGVTSGAVTLTVRSPSGVGTTFTFTLDSAAPATACVP